MTILQYNSNEYHVTGCGIVCITTGLNKSKIYSISVRCGLKIKAKCFTFVLQLLLIIIIIVIIIIISIIAIVVVVIFY